MNKFLLYFSLVTASASFSEVPVDANSGAKPIYRQAVKVPVVLFADVRRMLRLAPSMRPVFVDARFPENFNGHKLPGAVLLNIKTAEAVVLETLPDKNQRIIVYCSNIACPASYWMVERLVELAYSRVYEFSGGIELWQDLGGRIEPIADKSDQACNEHCVSLFP